MGWAGTTLDDRRHSRRRTLIDVGLNLLGTEGSAAVTVRSVCRHAKLTDRYFYESFVDRDALLVAVFDRVAAEARDALLSVAGDSSEAIARLATERFLAVLIDDPRKGRVLLLEPLTDPTLSRRAFEMLPLFADLVRAQMETTPTALEADMTATALIGALANLFGRWLQGDLRASRQEVTDFGVHLLTTLAGFSATTNHGSGPPGEPGAKDGAKDGADQNDAAMLSSTGGN